MASTRLRTTKRAGAVALALAAGSAGIVATAGSASALNWDAVAQCESGGNWGINTGNGYSGGLQFSASTWRAYGGKGSAAGASKSAQIAVAERVLAAQGPGAWPVCSHSSGAGSSSSSTPRFSSQSASRSESRHALTHSTTSTRTTRQHATTQHATTQQATAQRSNGTVLTTALVHQRRLDVRLLQQRLNRVDGEHLGLDGQYGSLTEAAVKRFQARHGLTPDGQAGLATQRLLRRLAS